MAQTGKAKRVGKQVLAGLAGLLAAVQFVRPARNEGASVPGPDSLVVRHQAPPEVRRILEVACYDCHSEYTDYPWYAEIQPSGWLLAWHVRRGKQAMNLSEFGRLSAKAQSKRLQYMIEAMAEGAMPPRSYQWMHADARLSEREIRTFTAWAETVQAKLAP